MYKEKMTKKLIVFVTLLFCVIGYSQEGTSSPYSYYGLGEVKFRGTQSSRAMGGLGIQGDSISLNLLNPASYSHLRLTTLAVGATSTFTNLENETEKGKAKRTGLDYLAVGIPMGKFGASLGVLPYSAVGYKLKSSTTIDGQVVEKSFTGEGNINKVFFGLAYSVNKKLSLGFDVQYNFGDIQNESIENNTSITLSGRERNTSRISGSSFNIGALYTTKWKEKYDIYTSFVFSPEARLNSTNERNLATVTFTGNGAEIVNDNIDIAVPNSKLSIPTKLALGLGLGEKNKWLIGSEVTFQSSSQISNRFRDEEADVAYKNSQKFVLGGFYIPKFDSYTSYLSRVVYRAGFRYENTGLVIKNKEINDYGMNFGLGLPLGYSKIDVGFEFGVRGTTYYNLVRENYFNLSIGLSLSDKWFKKRKID